MHYKITIQYDGLSYKGWQRLPDNPKTIQETIENALTAYTNEDIHISGSGRTDAGVSAKGQVADFHTTTPLKNTFLAEINQLLPSDISITCLVPVNDTFHSRKSATGKTYAYYVALDATDADYKADVFAARHLYTPNQGPLDLNAMKAAASQLIGTHDFSAFTTDKRKDRSHTRTVTHISFNTITCPSGKKVLEISVSGNGFLYNMVRIIVGTLVFCGVGKISPESIPNIISSKARINAGPTLPSNALFLMEVRYD